jgi:superfamily II DNA or RNA helicase
LDLGEAPATLAAYVAAAAQRALAAPGLASNLEAQVARVNEVISLLEGAQPADGIVDDSVVVPPQLLLEVHRDSPPGGMHSRIRRPSTPLRDNALLVRAPGEPAFASELNRELASADRVDLICAFVVWNGVRVLFDEISDLDSRGGKLRLITTTFTGITEARALEELIRRGAQVKVSYDTRGTRLHAKAWLFHRASGFGTAYVGSSNLTHTAIHDGLEWNVRLSEARSGELLNRFAATFESYWQDPQFEDYDQERFATAVERISSDSSFPLAIFDIHPLPFQSAILERLQVERERHGYWHNLVVAATGTGKTVMAALDYARQPEVNGRRPTLLFVAHRDEILNQSLATFRTVLKDGSFGEKWTGREKPTRGDYVFAAIQSLHAANVDGLDRSRYQVVIVDEFHHAAAASYRRLLDHLTPKLLLGLTATPERTDGLDITKWFDGRVAIELRLWDAIQQDLLCPFQYFGVADDVDLSAIRWSRGRYDASELSSIYTGNHARAAKVLEAVRRIVNDPTKMRALCFCVSVAHANFMAQAFGTAGIPSAVVTGDTPSAERHRAVQDLRAGNINALFSVDVFNEGLDVPGVDTVLFLRPTESATIFLQQLGRGLRKETAKSGLTVLDFIGQQNRSFRFAPRFAALAGVGITQLERDVEADFPFLPSGCSIRLDRVSRQIVLGNLRAALRGRRAGLVSDLRDLGNVSLVEFLRGAQRELSDVYAAGGWTSLRRDAGFAGPPGPDEDRLAGAIGRMQHIDDEVRTTSYRRWLVETARPAVGTSLRDDRLLEMLASDLWGRSRELGSLSDALTRFWSHGDLRQELVELLDVLDDQAQHLHLASGLPDEVPLLVHERYTRDEVLTALGDAKVGVPATSREGVHFNRAYNADVFFVTLKKSEERFSPTTMYRDYAVSPTLFHWESQSRTTANSLTGGRYQDHVHTGSSVHLFVRETTSTSSGAMPFFYIGPATYVSHLGERPMQITWRLTHALPGDFFQAAKAVA